MHIDQLNIINLTQLWQLYGTRSVFKQNRSMPEMNTSWPHRCWLGFSDAEQTSFDIMAANAGWLDTLPASAILPVWRAHDVIGLGDYGFEQLLETKKWVCKFTQLAMYKQVMSNSTVVGAMREGFSVRLVSSISELQTWLEIGSEAFGYDIPAEVFVPLLNQPRVKILLGWQDSTAVAVGLLFATGDVIGIHQVAVRPGYQGQGIARAFMQQLLSLCSTFNATHIVLQASEQGQPLYENLGFQSQFTIKNYQRHE